MEHYLAHIGSGGREQTVLEHLRGTARLCGTFASEFGAEEQGVLAGLGHDIGKYTQAFQQRIRGDSNRVDHSTAGAFECGKAGQNGASFCIAGHHGGLPDGGGQGDPPEAASWFGRMKRGQAGKLADYSAWKEEVRLPLKAPLPAFCGKDPVTDLFFIRMLYSCLVDADFLDTEEFMAGHPVERGDRTPVSELNRRLDAYVSGWFPPRGILNERRCAILSQCIEEGNRQKPGLFTLTVPTGGGKTVASLAFALRHAQAHGLKRIVYVIPYTSIIEQTADTFRRILGEDVVLEHHSGVEFDFTDTDGAEGGKLARASENWDMKVVVTTAVQFFESLYSARSSSCRKLHNLANSVLIFDEAQMLPVPYLRPCVSAICQLVQHYGCSAVLCTATQPALEGLFKEFCPEAPMIELCLQELREGDVFRRVVFQKAGELSWEELAQALNEQSQALCIVNSRKSAHVLYQALSKEGRFHLSTLMVPAHRRQILKEIRRRLTAGEPCRVVSTSLIEAGVDVDFPRVFREEAGLDSILQAAGRCNREGRRPAEDSIVTVFRAEEPAPPLFSIPIAAGRSALRCCEDPSSQEAIELYFHELLDLKGEAAQDSHGILPLIRAEFLPFQKIAQRFRLIETDTRTIYIPIGPGEELVERYRQGERGRSLFRQLGQYSVSIYDQHFRSLYEAGALEILDDRSAILLDRELYSQETGLSLKADNGQALFI